MCVHVYTCEKTINEAASDTWAVLCLHRVLDGQEAGGTGNASIPPAGPQSPLSREDSKSATN